MPIATMTAPKTTSRGLALATLRRVESAGPERTAAALESLGRKAAIEAAEARLRHDGAAWTASDRDWRSRDAVKAVRSLEDGLGRELTDGERGIFLVAMIDLTNDLV